MPRALAALGLFVVVMVAVNGLLRRPYAATAYPGAGGTPAQGQGAPQPPVDPRQWQREHFGQLPPGTPA